MLNKVKTYIKEHNLFNKEHTHLVALSGGADSVCLLRMMLQLNYNVHAVHCNFQLRGEESQRDEYFCQQLCQSLGVTLHLVHFDTRIYAETHKVSIEMAARELRYDYFEELRKAIGAADIVVAHHRDDNVETVLMNLIRGTGIQGLTGIKPRNGNIIRPLLCLSREEITDYLTLISQPYVTDSTNLTDEVTRNKVRLNLIPILKSINPAAVENINRTINNVAEAAKIIDHATKKSVNQCLTNTEEGGAQLTVRNILAQPSPEQTLFTILTNYNFTPQQIRHIYQNLAAPSGKIWNSTTHTLASDRGTFLIEKREDDDSETKIKIPECGIYIYKEDTRIEVSIIERNPHFTPSKEKLCVTLDADKVTFPLTIRRVKQGDNFVPFGMKGSRLVSDYLTDKKRNYFQRKKQMVAEDAKGNIIWLIGERTSQKASCSASTIKVLTIRYINKPQTR